MKVSDAVYSNLRGDVPAKIAITYDDLKHLNPRIVCCSLSGFGTTGPRRAEPGYDYIIQGLTGWMDITAAAHTIVDIVGCAGLGAFFFDDQAAIKGLFTIQGVVGV